MRAPNERAQSTIELALVVPIVVLVVLVMMQILVVARDATALTAATRAAARQAIVGERGDALQRAALAERRLNPQRLSVSAPTGAPGDLVAITGTYRAPTDVPIVGRLIGDIVLRERMVVMIE